MQNAISKADGALILMLAVTGKPTKAQIEKTLKDIKAVSIFQVMLYPRSGCELRYMETEWFDTIGHFLACAEKLNMKIWLYDDFNWPSGQCKGLVTKHNAFLLKSISVIGDSAGSIHKGAKSGDFFDYGRFPDLFSFETVKFFIENTHEQYYKHFKQYFGTVIKGIFTDEPSVSYACSDQDIPYYTHMEIEYAKKIGSDMFQAIKKYSKNPTLDSDLIPNCFSLITDRFNKSYFSALSDWCRAHNILLTGHLLADDTPFKAIKASGNILKQIVAFDVPGIDELVSNFKSDHIFSLFGVAEYAGRNSKYGAMAEIFSLGPCDMCFSDRRRFIYFAACFKIANYFLAISHMDMRGNASIKDFYNDFSPSQPNFAYVKYLAKDAEFAAELARKSFTPSVYIKYPVDACAKRLFIDNKDDLFIRLLNALSAEQIQWQFIDESDDFMESTIPVISMNSDFQYCLNGYQTCTLDELRRFLSAQPIITDAAGNVPEGIFVRKYNDGTKVIIDLDGNEARMLYFEGVSFVLHGVSIFKELNCSSENGQIFSQAALSETDITYANDNIIRAMFVNQQDSFALEIKQDLTIVFALRTYKCDVPVLLDGKPLEAREKAHLLPDGLKGLYHQTKEIVLKAGRHIITAGQDFKYLPTLFICGKFQYEFKTGTMCAAALDRRVQIYKHGQTIRDFGEICFESTVYVPSNAKVIRIVGAKLPLQIYFNGEKIGTCLYEPYQLKIPQKFKGMSLRIKMEQSSFIAPIFADTAYWDKNTENVSWRSTPDTLNTCFGFEKIEWGSDD